MLLGLIYLLSTEMPNLKIMYRTLGRDLRAAYLFFKTQSFIKKCHLSDKTLIDNFRSTVEKNRHGTCFIFQDEKWTYQMVDELSNKVANYFASRGYSKGDEVALLLDNCPEYVCIWLGLAKIGVVTALINTNLKRDSLGHSINCIDVKALIFGRNFSEIVKDAQPFFNNKDSFEFFCFTERGASTDGVISFQAKSLNTLLEEASTNPIDPKKYKISFHDKLFYIYTSGTTGLPKAAIIRHSRFLWIGAAAQHILQLDGQEVIYNPLPMYHTAGGLLFVSVIFVFGGSMIIRKKFSASNYWKEAAKHKATIGQYIGEICRYLLNQPVREEEKQHCIKLMFGNGLRSHIWKEFQERFRIKRIVEIYGATEGNANLVNMFGKQGAVGFLTRICDRLYPVSLVKVDPETREILRNEKGFCIRCKAEQNLWAPRKILMDIL
ncbi:Long-chain fatty acid transport protein 4 [Araneus ventricosus]|uniref:Long-chain-fatty-acid--CoA ligase n=1 Tax=Araneus ventricosus TaxID=182803 RepID=A0A4Y2FWE6_ARAVE|nr:Long-chain fatty acid transport protein 4 [Araneus ventricosus]